MTSVINTNNNNSNVDECDIHGSKLDFFCGCDGNDIKKYCAECMMENHFGGGLHKTIRIPELIAGVKSEYCTCIDKLKVIKKDIEELNNKNKPSASDENNNNVFYFIIFDKFIIIFIFIIFYRMSIRLKVMKKQHLKKF